MTALRVALIARHTLPAALAALVEAADHLARAGASPVIEVESATQAGLAGRFPTVAREALGRDGQSPGARTARCSSDLIDDGLTGGGNTA